MHCRYPRVNFCAWALKPRWKSYQFIAHAASIRDSAHSLARNPPGELLIAGRIAIVVPNELPHSRGCSRCITIFIAIGAADGVVCRLQNVFLNATRKRDNESVSRRPCLFRFRVPNFLSSDTVVVYIPQLFWVNFKSSSKILVASYDAYRRLFQFQHNRKFRVKLFRIAFGAPRPSLSDRVCGIGMRVYPTDR